MLVEFVIKMVVAGVVGGCVGISMVILVGVCFLIGIVIGFMPMGRPYR